MGLRDYCETHLFGIGPFAGRFWLCLIFLYAGVDKIVHFQEMGEICTVLGLGGGNIYLFLSIVFELVGGLLLLLGWNTRLGCLILMLYLLPVTLIFHGFWNYEGAERALQITMFLKNLTIYGGLFLLATYGPGRWSLDASTITTPKK